MKMKKVYKRILITVGILVILGVIILPPFHKWARKHVNYQTAVDDHPLNCFSCHLYTQKTGFIPKLINADYYSPFNLAIAPDGKRLYVVAEEDYTLLVVNTLTGEVEKIIEVGDQPHSVILDNEGKRAYVSNQWADNISVIDLDNLSVIDTLKTGNGPAGIALSSDEKYIYSVNSYTNDISVIELQSGREVKRLFAGNNPTGIEMSPDKSKLYITSRRALLVPYGDPVATEITVVDDKTKIVSDRVDLESAYMMENIAFTPEGDWLITPLIRPKNLIPSIQVERGL